MNLRLSPLAHTWILDLDGTLVKHNGYLIDGKDSFLPGAREFLASIPEGDFIVVLTSRAVDFAPITEKFLADNGVRFDKIIYGAPYGERILLNDAKPSGLNVSVALSKPRDSADFPSFTIDETL